MLIGSQHLTRVNPALAFPHVYHSTSVDILDLLSTDPWGVGNLTTGSGLSVVLVKEIGGKTPSRPIM